MNHASIITSPGRYITRSGLTVEISEIKGPGSASCKGHLLKPTESGRVRRIWNSWQPNGRFLFLGDHPRDIVSKA